MASECGGCRKPVIEDEGIIKCSGSCKQTFHLGCTPIQTQENITRLGVRAEKWECPTCSTKNAENAESFIDEVVTRSALEDVIGELKIASSEKTDEVIKDLVELKKSVGFLSRQVEEFKNTVAQVEDEISQLQTENSRLQTRNGNLWRTVVRLGDDLCDLQQLRCGREVSDIQAARETVTDEIASPKAVVALGLSCLTVAGILYMIATRIFNRAMNIMKHEPDQIV